MATDSSQITFGRYKRFLFLLNLTRRENGRRGIRVSFVFLCERATFSFSNLYIMTTPAQVM